MFDIYDLNRMAINRLAADMLRSVGKEPEPDRLHFLELLFWSLEQGHSEIEMSVGRLAGYGRMASSKDYEFSRPSLPARSMVLQGGIRRRRPLSWRY